MKEQKPPSAEHANGKEEASRIGAFAREFFLADDGRPITLARSVIGFVIPKKNAPDEITLGLRITSTKPITVRGDYQDIVAWWNSPPPKPRNGGQDL